MSEKMATGGFEVPMRLTISIAPDAAERLKVVAQQERRNTRNQAAVMLERVLTQESKQEVSVK